MEAPHDRPRAGEAAVALAEAPGDAAAAGFIPVYEPGLGPLEREYVLRCLDSGWISSKGGFVGRFEQELAAWTGHRHGVAVCNGTAALHVALLGVGVGPGDEVIVPTLTYVASVNAIAYAGAKPVFVDCDAETWQMDPAAVAAAVGPRTAAILAVHLYGQPCDTPALHAVAARHGLAVVEDAAEALGSATPLGHVGAGSDAATLSFYGNKTLTTGEGGMVLTHRADVAERVAKLKGQGLAGEDPYWHDEVGFNYRMTNICAAIGCAQLQRLDGVLARKRAIAARYRERLPGLAFQATRPGTVHSHWMVCLRLPEPKRRDAVRWSLLRRGIETRPVFHPVHRMPMHGGAAEDFPVSSAVAAAGLNLPSHPGLADAQVDRVAASLREAL
ncbi:DegT/DnrJ/EryC1/StrS family aminotransferase [Phycisphaera mikurensis]|uniref:Putative aminotransferase n=1 Tax=Phycisphaera mikurensis (strain NBRC 102666 / KCTC 22515 / FYK2301M01) TaxID=1142394 RepID=I0IHE6_PHYMF|nr:DegT/DnrJ/EryC1/StrS family aminotransferase [Phycisphaera mikurensis]MBB6440932.1 perosamine synthetase [Phycisphaera mikurensis]BAM04684.1 putative aminotransferase [Phycisphaera mikurensis NBRC 102666]